MLEYTLGDELGDAGLFWEDSFGQLIDLSSGYTFELKVYDGDGAALFTKTTGITGAAGSLTTVPPTPNLAVAWATSNELSSIATPGTYPFRVVATRTSGGKTRTFRGTIKLLPTV